MLKNGIKNISKGISERNRLILSGAAKISVCALGGFLFAQATIGDFPSPLIVALVSALSLVGGFCASVGALLGYIITDTISTGAIEISAVILTVLVKVIVCDIFGREMRTSGKALLAGSAEVISGIVFAFLNTFTGGVVFLIIARGILCVAATYFLCVVVRSAKEEKHLVVTGFCGGSLGMVLLFFIASMCSVSTEIFSLGRIAAVFCILIAAKRWGYRGGGVVGIIALSGIALNSAELGFYAMMIPMAAVVAGFFQSYNRIIIMLSFIITNAVGLVMLGISPETARMSVDIIIGSAAFILTPDAMISAVLGIEGFSKVDRTLTEQVSSRLNFAASSVGEIRKQLAQINNVLNRDKADDDLAVRVCDGVCSKCRYNLECWENDFDRTFEGFEKTKRLVMQNIRISDYELPTELSGCRRKAEIAAAFSDTYREQIFEERTREKLDAMRGILEEQFLSMEALLGDTAEQIQSSDRIDERLSEEVRMFISDFGGRIVRGNVFRDDEGILRIEAFYSGEVELSPEEVAEELSDITGVEITFPQLITSNGVSKMTATEKPHYEVEFDILRKDGKEGFSADTCENFEDGKGNAYFIIADGMGSGKMAALDSRMSVSFFRRLICGGAGLETTVGIINSSVKVKPNDESFSTMDILKVNLYTGEAEMIKLGSAPSFLKSRDRFIILEDKTFPVGIMNEIKVNRNKFRLFENDLLLMASDGVDRNLYPDIRKILTNGKESKIFDYLDYISKVIDNKSNNAPEDDVTIIALKLINSINKQKIRDTEKICK